MKNLLTIALMLITVVSAQSQIFVGKGDLKIGLKVDYEGVILNMDTLCTGYDPETGVPQNLVIPPKSSLGFIYDSLRAGDISLILDSKDPKPITRPARQNKSFGFSTSSSPGSKRSFTLVDDTHGDTLKIEWTVGYLPVELIDLFPSNYFEDYVSVQIQNIFSDYPDSSQFDWAAQHYIDSLNERGIPVNPTFPHGFEGLYFAVDNETEDTWVKLEGFHEDFQQVDVNKPYELFLYRDLPPGEYVFKTLPYIDAPENTMRSYSFTILRPWWEGTWATIIITFITTAIGGVLAFIRYYKKQTKKKERIQWEKKITEAELKALRAQLNPHFIFNAMNSIQNLVSKNENEKANQYISTLSRLLRQVLDVSEKQFHELGEELDLIKSYLEIEALRFNFKYTFRVIDKVDQSTLVPVMLLQPLVENAVKHGVSGKTDGLIEIISRCDNEYLHLCILDNGKGIEAENKESMGLKISSERMGFLRHYYGQDARIDLRNRKDQSGVEVCIKLPIS